MPMQFKSYQARWIVPVSSPPIHNGWLQTDGVNVLQIGRGTCPHPHQDLGDVAILPQLVNAHTHLEFSHLTGPIGSPNISLADWIGFVIAARGSSPPRAESIRRGIDQSRQSGVTLVGEITTPPCEYRLVAGDPTLACFAETLGLSPQRSEERMRAAKLQTEFDPWCGLSPHAPYSTSRDTILACVDISNRSGRSLAMHVAESPAERELLEHARGPFIESLQRLGVLRDDLFPWGPRPFHWLIDTLSRSSRALLIHGNDLNSDEITQLAPHHHLSVVYCPRTHTYFGYDEHPVQQLLSAGVRVALGTDSLASNPDLSIWSEVQHLLNHRPDLHSSTVLEMATLNGADALGYPKLGRIEVGCNARLGLVKSTATTIQELYHDWGNNPFVPMSTGKVDE